MAVQGDLSSSTQLEVKKHGSLLLVDDIQFANFKLDGRSAATDHTLITQDVVFLPILSNLFKNSCSQFLP